MLPTQQAPREYPRRHIAIRVVDLFSELATSPSLQEKKTEFKVVN